MTSLASRSLLAFIVLALTAGVATASPKVETKVLIVCSTDDVTFDVVRTSPLIIDASLHHQCNTTHAINVTYRPENLSNPQRLKITLEGRAPDITAPGSASFTNLPYTNAVQRLRITYRGPRSERQRLVQTVHVSVTY